MDSLLARYDALVCDLDGVVYRGPEAVPHAVDALNAAARSGVGIAYATNNASRPPAEVATHLRELGVDLADDAVINSSQAGATALAETIDAGAVVLAIGGAGVALALKERGFRAVTEAGDEQVAAVLQGYGPAVTADDLAQAAYAIQGGARWVATNTDLTLPTARGTAPGNGSLVAAVRAAVDIDPEVVGKPGALMYVMAARQLRTTPAKTLGIGDRLETDVAGATAAAMDCLHVLTGVHGPTDLVMAAPGLRPRYVAADLRALALPYDEPQQQGDPRSISYATETVTGRLVFGEGAPSLVIEGSADPIERLRVTLRILWDALDAGVVDQAAARSWAGDAH
ncbi:HAD-IIA family hydrolase [Calidifontibacter terrae]